MPWDTMEHEELESEVFDQYTCPICGSEDCVPPSYGVPGNDILWIGEEPGGEEIVRGKPFLGNTGRLLKSELQYLGLSLYGYRLCNLWIHPSNKNDDCFERSVKIVLNEAKGKRLVVLVGSDTVKFFTGQKVSEWNGLLVESPMLNNPYILAMVQPTTVWHGSIGEMKFALQRFKYYAELEKINA